MQPNIAPASSFPRMATTTPTHTKAKNTGSYSPSDHLHQHHPPITLTSSPAHFHDHLHHLLLTQGAVLGVSARGKWGELLYTPVNTGVYNKYSAGFQEAFTGKFLTLRGILFLINLYNSVSLFLPLHWQTEVLVQQYLRFLHIRIRLCQNYFTYMYTAYI